jgi:hypothetical protein
MDYYDLEFAFRAHVSQDAAYQAFAACLSLPDSFLVSYDEYIELMPWAITDRQEELSRYMGVKLLWDNNDGYKTLMRAIYYGEDLPDSRLEEICYCLAKRLDTEVAVGDFIHVEYPDTFIVYTPSGERWFGVDACKGYNELIKTEYEDE